MTEPDTPRRRRKLSAIMMADVSGFSRMMGSNEEDTVNLIQDFHARVQELVERHEGRVVDTAGDSVFGEFDSVFNALACSRRIQEQQTALNGEQPADRQIEMRIGVHLGDVIVEDYHVYGDGVNIAARLEGLAVPGGIAISEAVYQQVQHKLDVPVRDLGLQELKNIRHPVHVYEVQMGAGEAAVAAAPVVQPAVDQSPAIGGEPPPLPREPLTREPLTREPLTWRAAVVRTSVLIPALIGLFLLLSPVFLFPSGGALPTIGAVMLGVLAGRVAARVQRFHGAVQYGLGIAVASGALWTNWSRVTNALFVLTGLIIAVTGLRRPAKRRKGKKSKS